MDEDIKQAVDTAEKPKPKNKSLRGVPYERVGNQMYLKTGEEGRKPLCNFMAAITEETLYDDGTDEEVLFRIEGKLHNGKPLAAVEIPASKFSSMGWVSSAWGARAVVMAGSSTKDHLRAAIQLLSKSITHRTVYGHMGWRKIEDQWVYLHAGGAIGGETNRTDIEVRTGEGHMQRYRFAGAGDDVQAPDASAALRASLRLLDLAPNNPILGVLLLAAIYRAPLGEAAPIDFGIFVAGMTGARKSEAVAMALAHFGRGFDARHSPANWEDTESDLEAKGHTAKDALFVVDDFKPRGGPNDVHKLHVKADRLFRSVGNQAGRGRRTAEMKQRAAYYPRGLVVATGEDVPRGQSLRARLAVVEVSLADVDNRVLSELQRSAHEGLLEQAMIGYLRWLAPEMEALKQQIPHMLLSRRKQILEQSFIRHAHPRAVDMYASLLVGIEMFLDYLASAELISCEERMAILARCEQALQSMIGLQEDLQIEQDEVEQFLDFLKSGLNAGYFHFADAITQGPPDRCSYFWGWRVVQSATDERPEIKKSQGEMVGWVDDSRIYMDGHIAFAAAESVAKGTGEHLAITERTLWKRMDERGLLQSVHEEGGQRHRQSRRTLGGVFRRVYVLSRKTIEDH